MKRKRMSRRAIRSRKRRGIRKRVRRSGGTSSRQGMRPMSFRRTFWSQYFVPTTVSTTNFWQYFSTTFGTLPNVSEYTNLFDSYKVNGVKYTFVPKYTGFNGDDATTAGTTNRGNGFVSVINDPRNVTTATGTYGSASFNAFQELGNSKLHSASRSFSVYYKPFVDDPMSVGTRRVPCSWLQTSNTAQPLNGFHAYFHDSNFSGVFNQNWDVYITLYFQCRGMK